jgi:23S rRNA (uridine2552-2'-O)-methyltransferase
MMPLDGALILQQDLIEDSTADLILKFVQQPVDVILSDVVHTKVDEKDTDCLVMCTLNSYLIDICAKILKPGGVVLTRTLTGAEEPGLYAHYCKMFGYVQRIRPSRSKQYSRNVYYLAEGWRKGVGVKMPTKEEQEETTR